MYVLHIMEVTCTFRTRSTHVCVIKELMCNFQNQKYYLARSIGMCYNRGDVDFQSKEVLVYVSK